MIPPKKFYKLSKVEQEEYAVKEMNNAYSIYEQWKKVSQQARKNKIFEPQEIDRPDLDLLKS
ncbi:MAG: hypothetical protein D4R41_01880 [Sediminibacterium sp.]|nr:MAG: hypothetical protein D4R41_01880 [Sediminibacterium sp.]